MGTLSTFRSSPHSLPTASRLSELKMLRFKEWKATILGRKATVPAWVFEGRLPSRCGWPLHFLRLHPLGRPHFHCRTPKHAPCLLLGPRSCWLPTRPDRGLDASYCGGHPLWPLQGPARPRTHAEAGRHPAVESAGAEPERGGRERAPGRPATARGGSQAAGPSAAPRLEGEEVQKGTKG